MKNELVQLVKFNEREVILADNNTHNVYDATGNILDSYISSDSYYTECDDFNELNRRSALLGSLFMDKVYTIVNEAKINTKCIMNSNEGELSNNIDMSFNSICSMPISSLAFYYGIDKGNNINPDVLARDVVAGIISSVYTDIFVIMYDGTAESAEKYNNLCKEFSEKTMMQYINAVTSIIRLGMDIASNQNVIEFNNKYEKSML